MLARDPPRGLIQSFDGSAGRGRIAATVQARPRHAKTRYPLAPSHTGPARYQRDANAHPDTLTTRDTGAAPPSVDNCPAELSQQLVSSWAAWSSTGTTTADFLESTAWISLE